MARARNSMANQNNGAVIAPLQSAASSLAQADHDYQGHRVKAIQHVATAIRHLEPASARQGQPSPAAIAKAAKQNGAGNAPGAAGNAAGAGAGANGNKKGRTPQNASDGHLRNALQTLNNVHSQISMHGSTRNHGQALASVQNAIQELNQALAVR